MAQAIYTGTIAGPGRISFSLDTLKAALRRRAIYRQTVQELNALSSRELTDLGIRRSEIRSIARDAAFGA
ncbi:DUF1127 domain-containing protein [Falsirhodobacter algicola]|uniref:DUF1127 domain-containing protein n=1 Tax=Falsirhodobacter algicola TaxID=2692330 RepID=UPI001BA66901|nr:DUF1127 domain-containing protein [Falsirhodobacter algicola]